MRATLPGQDSGGREEKLGNSGEGFVHGPRAVLAAGNCLLPELCGDQWEDGFRHSEWDLGVAGVDRIEDDEQVGGGFLFALFRSSPACLTLALRSRFI